MKKSLLGTLLAMGMIVAALLLVVKRGALGAAALIAVAAVLVLVISFFEGLAGLLSRRK